MSAITIRELSELPPAKLQKLIVDQARMVTAYYRGFGARFTPIAVIGLTRAVRALERKARVQRANRSNPR